MPDWNDLLYELKKAGSNYDILRRKYMTNLSKITGRNTIIYYSGWFQKPDLPPHMLGINDSDKIGFMTAIHNLDRKKGLDLILHTPGGDTSATESLVDYLRSMFDSNIRAIVPQLALSAGTMLACACKSILMGKQSSLGPIDPQLGGLPAHGVIEEFKRAYTEAKEDQLKIPLWQPIIAKYHPTLIGECDKAIAWSEEIVREWLETGMFKDDTEIDKKIDNIIKELGGHALTKSHARHISITKAREIGLKIEPIEDNNKLQDAILSIHHICIHTLTGTNAFKMIENQMGKAYIQIAPTPIIPMNR